ncbi:MAG TPA: Rieske 2Fe-2S domain-containing protein [Chthonomonadales bacterium]|nr:Rieske 2Fe-2S domain-containing protein [Chthonomonadales bacterium]
MNDIPKWRKDFPIRWEADNYTTRREFTKFLVLVSGATFLGNGYFALQAFRKRDVFYPSVVVAAVDEVPVGSVKLFRYPTEHDPAILIRLGEEQFAAFLQRCTHLSCPVLFNARDRRLECPCHNGVFDAATGHVLAGPPPRPLPRIVLHIEEGRIFARGIEGA